MLFQLNDTTKANMDELLAFAKQNEPELSLVDETDNDLFLPGNPLTPGQLKK